MNPLVHRIAPLIDLFRWVADWWRERSQHPRLVVEFLDARSQEGFVLPMGYESDERFPKRATLVTPGFPELVSFLGSRFRVRNTGKEAALDCEPRATLYAPAGSLPVTCYWVDETEVEVTIPSRGSRDFLAFLVDPTTHEVVFSTDSFPRSRRVPCWQYRISTRVPFMLDIEITSKNALVNRRLFSFVPQPDNPNAVKLLAVEAKGGRRT